MDPMDIRHAWILWINRDERGFSSSGAYHDPRTGDDVLLRVEDLVMEFPVGRTGLKVSEICLGTMTFGSMADEATSLRILDKAFDAGIDFLDAAEVYPVPPDPKWAGRTEEIVGMAIAEIPRDRVVLSTKKKFPLTDPGNPVGEVRKSLEQSLKRLGTDYIDVYMLHRPDDKTPQEETLRGFEDLIRSGKVRHIGNSNFSAAQVREADNVVSSLEAALAAAPRDARSGAPRPRAPRPGADFADAIASGGA